MIDPVAAPLARPPASRLIGFGLRQTTSGRFSVVRVSVVSDYDMRGGAYVLRRRFTAHTGLPGSVKVEQVAIDKAQALVAKEGGTYLGYRADGW